MKVHKLLFAGAFVSFCVLHTFLVPGTKAQEPAIELPVELVGFPVIILAVRLSNFAKKLAYSLNPRTYTSRTKRSSQDMIDMVEAEKRLVEELGNGVCIYTKVCLYHAAKTNTSRNKKPVEIDWNQVFSQYKTTKEKQKEYYLLSIFLGEIVGSWRFCNQLAKRGRACSE